MSFDAANLLDKVLADWSADEIQSIISTWQMQAREDQWPPVRAQNGQPWTVWLVMGGRGAGIWRRGKVIRLTVIEL
jgi:phage terminase large subunit-like protein